MAQDVAMDEEMGCEEQQGEQGEHGEVECKVSSMEEWEELKSNANVGDSIRCRFSSRSHKLVDVPVEIRREDGCTLLCKFDVECLGEGAKVSILLPNGKELSCKPLEETDQVKGVQAALDIYRQLPWLDRYLFIWIFVDMAIALVVGNYAKSIKKHLDVLKLASVSLPIAIGLWVMMYPVLCKVRYELLGNMLRGEKFRKNLLLSLVLNWLVGPAIMTGLAWATLPDLPAYRTGVILVGIARCIAMVLIWNDLARGDVQLCAILVAVNSVLQILLYTPLSLFYLRVISKGHSVNVGFWDVCKSVLLFLGIPLVAGLVTRYSLQFLKGRKWYDTKFLPVIGPWALIGLLYTIFVMFSIQAHEIVQNIGYAARVVVPLLLYFAIIFGSTIAVCRHMKLPYAELVTQSFTAASNNFELAIAVAVGSFGIDSHEALAATIGPLIEVPVLLGLVYLTRVFAKQLSPSR